jgi:thiol-disulfide isomerase/thioredoxin
MKLISLLLATVLLAGCSTGGIAAPDEISFVGGSGNSTFIEINDRKAAPLISGELLDGTNKTLDKNQVKVINVWASWCAPCRAEAPLLQEFSIQYPEVQFAGILTRDNLSSARVFVENFGLTYPTFIDDALLIGFRGSLIPNAIPTTLIIDKNNLVAVRISGEVTVGAFRELLNKILAEK